MIKLTGHEDVQEIINIVLETEGSIDLNAIPPEKRELVRDIEYATWFVKRYWHLFEPSLKEAVMNRIILNNERTEQIIESYDERSHDMWHHFIYRDSQDNEYIYFTTNTDFNRCEVCGGMHDLTECYVDPKEIFWLYRKIEDREYLIPVRRIK